MAKRVVTYVSDDLDGTDGAETHTIAIAIDGNVYEIDLGTKSYDKLTKALAPFIDEARPASQGRPAPSAKKPAKPAQLERGYDIVQLREWTGRTRSALPSRGRVPAAVVAQFKTAAGR